jgi:hypothetical protein
MRSNRRNFLKKSLYILGTVPLLEVGSSRAWAQEMKPLDEGDPQAQALGYKHDATKVDTTKFPKRAQAGGEKQLCSNCVLLLQSDLAAQGAEGTQWGKCALFPQGLVSLNGWCNSWAPKAT